ncbi:MAG: hypothetical protein JSW58_04335 [Candidatus Latescibacterota bacterium]|nr:MAG: hypothetical protein JSW58_04335 [Candidatus Latescibacterota bacterium]
MKLDAGKKPRKAAAQTTAPTYDKGQERINLLEKHGNTMVLLTIASVIVSTLVGVGFLSPLFHTAAVFPFFYSAMKRRDHRWGVILVFRWAIALFVTLVVVGVFVPGRVASSLPLAKDAVITIDAWVQDSATGPPADLSYLLWGMVAFLVGSVVSGGLLGFIVGAFAIGGAAYGALHIFRHGLNVLQIALLAVPLWQLSLFLAAGFLLVPTSQLVFDRFFNVEKDPEDWPLLRNCMYIGAGFFVLSIIFRYAISGPWRSLLERWTVL